MLSHLHKDLINGLVNNEKNDWTYLLIPTPAITDKFLP